MPWECGAGGCVTVHSLTCIKVTLEIAAGRESASLSTSPCRDGKALSWLCLEERVVPLCMVHTALGETKGV